MGIKNLSKTKRKRNHLVADLNIFKNMKIESVLFSFVSFIFSYTAAIHYYLKTNDIFLNTHIKKL